MSKRRPDKMRFIVREMDPDDMTIADDVDRPAAKGLIEIAYHLDAEIAPYGWDQPTSLVTIRERSRRTVGNTEELYLETMGVPGFHDLLTATQRRTGRVHPAIVECAYRWEHLVNEAGGNAAAAGKDVLAVAMIYEAWMVTGDPKLDPEHNKALIAAAKEHRLHAHPERVEIRTVSICGRDDLRVGYMHPRDGVPIHTASRGKRTGTFPTDVRSQVGMLSGDIFDALAFVQATMELGRVPMPYDDWAAQYPDPEPLQQP